MTQAIDHTALPFDEIIDFYRMRPGDATTQVGCRIMQDGWEIGTWFEADWEGAGPVARKIMAVNDLLAALVAALPYVEMADADKTYKPGVVAKMVKTMRAAIAKAEGTP